MTYQGLEAISLAKIIGAFLLLFVYLPRRIFPQRKTATPIEAFFENLTLMTFCSVVLAEALALFEVYSLPSLLGGYLLLYLGVRWHRDSSSFIPRIQRDLFSFNVFILQTLDGIVSPWATLRRQLEEKRCRWKNALSSLPSRVHLFTFSVVLGLAAYLRSVDAFHHASLSYSDSYYHLEALKKLQMGQPYWEDLYPKGLHAFMSVLQQATWVDSVLVVKLVGPLIGILIVLSVYYTAFLLTRNPNACLISMAIASIVDGHASALFSYFGSNQWSGFFGRTLAGPFMLNERQTAALPQEFAMVFLLPALVFSCRYWTNKGRRRDLALLFTSATIILMTHWIVSVVLFGGLAILMAVALFQREPTSRTLRRALAAYLLAGFVGNFQFMGLVLGAAAAYASGPQLGYALALPARYASWLELWPEPVEFAPVLYAAAAVALVVGLFGLIGVRERRQRMLWIFIGAFTLALLFEIRALNFGIQYFVPPDRTGEFLSLLLPVGVGGLWAILCRDDLRRTSVSRYRLFQQVATVLVVLAVIFVGMPPGFASPPRYEYSSLAELYYQISRKYPPLQWTIVSNVEEYSKVLTKGWHINVADFLARFSPSQARLDVPTTYVFIFVEKVPLIVKTSYQDPATRRDEQRRLSEWVFTHNAMFGDMTQYYEDDKVLVYLLRPKTAPSP